MNISQPEMESHCSVSKSAKPKKRRHSWVFSLIPPSLCMTHPARIMSHRLDSALSFISVLNSVTTLFHVQRKRDD